MKHYGWCLKKYNDISKEIHAFFQHADEKKNRVIYENMYICEL